MSNQQRGLIPLVQAVTNGIRLFGSYFDPNNAGARPSPDHVLVNRNGFRFWVHKDNLDK